MGDLSNCYLSLFILGALGLDFASEGGNSYFMVIHYFLECSMVALNPSESGYMFKST